MPDVLLPEGPAERLAAALENFLEIYRRNHQPPEEDLREAAALLAPAVPLTAVKRPLLLKAAGPQAAAAAKAEARRMAASKVDADGIGSASLAPATLSASEAARIVGVSSQAIRAACATERLAASKNRITGAWQITAAALEEWMEERNAA